MRIVVTGASGNVGTSVLEALARDPEVEEIVGLARRLPERSFPRTKWLRADVSESDLVPIFSGADAVIHLAWLIQPSRDETREELGWEPTASATEAVLELLGGLNRQSGLRTPPLDPATSGRLRWRELLTGVGARDK